MDGMDDVEIKLNVDADHIEDAKRVFGLDGAGEPRAIWFGEVLDGLDGRDGLPLLGRGVILRFRDKRKSDGTLKLRGPDGGIDAAGWARRVQGLGKAAKLEGDWAGERRLISASISADLDEGARAALKPGHPPLRSMLSAAQLRLAADLMVPLDRVELLGPVAGLKWKADDGIEAEQWDAGGDLRFLEISIVAEDDPVGAMSRLLRRARDGGIPVEAGTQEPKTTRVLKALAARR